MQLPLFAQIEQARQVVDQAASTTPTEPVMETISIWQLIVDGGWYIMGPLGIMSLIAIYIIIERSMAIRRALREEKDFMNKVRDYIHEGKIDSARNLCSQTSSPVARMLDKGISRIGKPLKPASPQHALVGHSGKIRPPRALGVLTGARGSRFRQDPASCC